MRLHVVAIFCHEFPHPLEVGLCKHEGEELSKIVVLPWRSFLKLAAKLVREHLRSLGTNLPDFWIDLRIPPVWCPSHPQALDVAFSTVGPVNIVGDTATVHPAI